MKFGIFYELQLPRPWQPGDELRLYQQALTQLEEIDTEAFTDPHGKLAFNVTPSKPAAATE